MKSALNVLIVDDDPRMASTLKDILEAKGYRATAVNSGVRALTELKHHHFDCVFSDIKMPEVNGVELFRSIKLETPQMPVILMTAYSTDKLVQEGLDEGVISVLTKPLDITAILDFLNYLDKPCSVVIIDDDPGFGRTLGEILKAKGYSITQFIDPQGIRERLEKNGKVVVLLDMKLKDTTGLEVLKDIRETFPAVPVVLVTGFRDEMLAAIQAAVKLDAHTCLYKPLQIDKLLGILTDIYHEKMLNVLAD